MNDGRIVSPKRRVKLDRQARRYPRICTPNLAGAGVANGAPLFPALTSPVWFGKTPAMARLPERPERDRPGEARMSGL